MSGSYAAPLVIVSRGRPKAAGVFEALDAGLGRFACAHEYRLLIYPPPADLIALGRGGNAVPVGSHAREAGFLPAAPGYIGWQQGGRGGWTGCWSAGHHTA